MGLYENLKKYLENTPEEEIQRAWKATEKYDKINSPTMEEFSSSLKKISKNNKGNVNK